MEVKSGNIEILRGRQEEDEYVRYSVYLHYWYKNTKILTQKARVRQGSPTAQKCGSRGLGFRELQPRFYCSVYLIYWYKSANSDAEGAASQSSFKLRSLSPWASLSTKLRCRHLQLPSY
jgi:hypothetical protein